MTPTTGSMPSKSSMSRKMILQYIMQFVAVAVSIIGVTAALYSQLERTKLLKLQSEMSHAEIRNTQETLDEIKLRILQLEKKTPDTLTGKPAEDWNIALSQIQASVERIREETTGLRQALNPLQPEEVLTIARLGDQIKVLNEKSDRQSEAAKKEISDFKASILRELASSRGSTNLILVVLIPLVLNFLYTIWKDLRKDREVVTAQSQPEGNEA